MAYGYKLKRSRVGKPIEYPNTESLLEALEKILKEREARGISSKVWLTIEAIPDAAPTV